MSAQCGSAMIISLKDEGGTYRVVGGLRTKSISINAEGVDITNSDSAGRWRQYLDGCGIRSASMSGDGPFNSTDLGQGAGIEAVMSNEIREGKILIPDFGVFEGFWKITQLELSGDHDDAVTFNQTYESAGEITFTAE